MFGVFLAQFLDVFGIPAFMETPDMVKHRHLFSGFNDPRRFSEKLRSWGVFWDIDGKLKRKDGSWDFMSNLQI